jgi:hypothetical protein
MTLPEKLALISSCVGIVGGVLGVISWIQVWLDRRQKVRISIPSHDGSVADAKQGAVEVKIINCSRRPLRLAKINLIGIESGTGKQFILGQPGHYDRTDKMPFEMPGDSSLTALYSAHDTFGANLMSEFFAQVETESGKTFTSKHVAYKSR